MIAQNAFKIVELRRNGYRPDEMILVSLVGKLDELNHVVYALPKLDYDWRWCKGLEICIFASSGVNWQPFVKAISEAEPRFLSLWDVDRNEGAEFYRLPDPATIERPRSQWKMKLFSQPWCAIENKLFTGELCN